MKQRDVIIGGLYQAKVSDVIAVVRIDSRSTNDGWNATNFKTNRAVHIRSAQRLRRRVCDACHGVVTPENATCGAGQCLCAPCEPQREQRRLQEVAR